MGVDTADDHTLILRRSQADFQNLIMCCFYILTLYESKPKYKIIFFWMFACVAVSCFDFAGLVPCKTKKRRRLSNTPQSI